VRYETNIFRYIRREYIKKINELHTNGKNKNIGDLKDA
jgi:hypothetical protein